MKPINLNERKRAIFKVVGLFVISFLIAILVGFTTMNANRIADRTVKNRLEQLQNQQKFQKEEFTPRVEKLAGELAQLPTIEEQGGNFAVLYESIALIIEELTEEIVKNQPQDSSLYSTVVKGFSDLQVALKDIREKDQLGETKEQLQEQFRNCSEERDRLQSQISRLSAADGSSDIRRELREVREDLQTCQSEKEVLRRDNERLRRQQGGS